MSSCNFHTKVVDFDKIYLVNMENLSKIMRAILTKWPYLENLRKPAVLVSCLVMIIHVQKLRNLYWITYKSNN